MNYTALTSWTVLPPCSTFSTIGKREKTWGKEKVFREGQKKQTLDDLFFVFLDTVEKLKPKIVVAENVTGLVKGNAKGYVNQIIKRFKALGYDVQIFLLNAAQMDVPQARERVFFIANNQHYKKLRLNFNEKEILFGEVRTSQGINAKGQYAELLKHYDGSQQYLEHIKNDLKKEKRKNFRPIIRDNQISFTLVSGSSIFRGADKKEFSVGDCVNVQTFPQDYDFLDQDAKYICGMSVPPNMIANIATEIYKQWLQTT